MQQSFSIKAVAWNSQYQPTLKAIRKAVFIVEQSVPVSLEWDAEDAAATHLIALYGDQPIACARIVKHLQACKIGRMAVLQSWRGQGFGQQLLKAAIDHCRPDTNTIQLSAQTQVVPFYEKSGFTVTSEPYLDANIWHVDMVLTIND